MSRRTGIAALALTASLLADGTPAAAQVDSVPVRPPRIERILLVDGPRRQRVEGPTDSVQTRPGTSGAWNPGRVEMELPLRSYLRVRRSMQVQLRYRGRDGHVTLVTGHGMWDVPWDGVRLIEEIPGAAVYEIDTVSTLVQGTAFYRDVVTDPEEGGSWTERVRDLFPRAGSDFVVAVDSLGAQGFVYVKDGRVSLQGRVVPEGWLVRLDGGAVGTPYEPARDLRRDLDRIFDRVSPRPFLQTRLGKGVVAVGVAGAAWLAWELLRSDPEDGANAVDVVVRIPR